MYEIFGIRKEIEDLSIEVEKELEPIFKGYDENCALVSAKVLKAFQDNNVSTSDFIEVTGYGYSDTGRDKLEKVYA